MSTDRLTDLRIEFAHHGCMSLWPEMYDKWPYEAVLKDCEARADGLLSIPEAERTPNEQAFLLMVQSWS